jgi:UDP-3-O-[3-hydroxymyristoyl] N-acetylglucosamine deacetylase
MDGCKTVIVVSRLTAQRTLSRPILMTGLGGFNSGPAQVALIPANEGQGLLLRGGRQSVRLNPNLLRKVHGFSHTTCLVVSGGPVVGVEHLLATISGFGITNLIIEVGSSGHVPFFDGSAMPFARAIAKVGTLVQNGGLPVKRIVVTQPMSVVAGEARAILSPPQSRSHRLRVQSHIDFPEPIGVQYLDYLHTRSRFLAELAAARTFMSAPWDGSRSIDAFPGFYHVDCEYRETNMVTHDGTRFHVDPRMANEQVAHKTLDAVGDLAVLGIPLSTDIILHRPGHLLMHKVVHRIASIASISYSRCINNEDIFDDTQGDYQTTDLYSYSMDSTRSSDSQY